jgi:sialate O-acetylesterase
MKPALRLCLPAILVTATALLADVRTPTVFGPNMVFQQGRALPVWGWAEAGEKVTVALAGKQTGTTANAKGEWRVDLPAMTTATGLTLTIQGTNTLTYPNVAVGEVWLGSGQSNMQWTVSNSVNPKEEIAAANFPEIRLYYVPRVPAGSPQTDVKAEWKVCTPETVPGFSAALYFFGRELHKELKVPLGLIHTSWGGTRIEPWTPPNGFAAVPALETIHDQVSLSLPHTAVHKEALAKHLAALDGWIKATRAAAEKNLSPPPMPAFNNGLLPLGTHTKPTGLYNGMVHALIPFAIRGAIWYQGESNRNDGEFYFEKMKALILGWRELWGQGDFPFYFVQLAPYRYGGSPTKLAEIWMGQTKSLSIPNTGMAVTLDIGNVKDIHPRKKQQVGRRLALWALAKDYGKDIVYSGPMFRSVTVEDKAIRVAFDHVGGGLVSRDGAPLTWFEVIGKEGEWTKAEGKIDGEAILVSSPDVPLPCAVRFAWHQLAEPNLMNKAGLPAPAFVGGKPPVFENLALNKPFTSSDPNAYGTSWRLGLTDGNWGSDSLHCFASSSTATFPKYATIDLGEAVSVNRVVFGVPNFGSTKDVKIQISTDGKAFTEVGTAAFTMGKAERKTIRFPLAQARYVRLAYTGNHTVKKDYDVNFVFTQEVEVYGPPE